MPITKKVVGGAYDDKLLRIKEIKFHSDVYPSMKEFILDLGWMRRDPYYTCVENKQKEFVKVRRDPYEMNKILTHQADAKVRIEKHRAGNGTDVTRNLPSF